MNGRFRIGNTVIRATLAAGLSACLALALHAPSASPHAQLELVDGTLSQSNSKSGAAILSVADMRPGETAGGSVTIANTGSARGDFALSSFDVTDVPGRGGGLLSTALVASVIDVTNPTAPRRVYSGSLGAMTTRALGGFGPGSEHTYSFSVGLPVGGPGLNDVQGASVSVGYRWTATVAPAGPPTTPTPTTTTPPPPPVTEEQPPPGTTTTPQPPPTTLAPFKLRLTGKGKWSARKRRGPAVTARCSRVCSLRATVKVRGMGRRKLALKVKSKPMASRVGRAMRFQIVLKKKPLRKVRRAIKRHKRVKIVVSVRAMERLKLVAKASKRIRVKR